MRRGHPRDGLSLQPTHDAERKPMDALMAADAAASEKVVVLRKEKSHVNSPLISSLASETIASLKAFFDARDHHPSEAMWTALIELASVLEAMAEGRCPPKLFLSSLDPGVG